jgi:sterol 3beta-glucosyltransferase
MMVLHQFILGLDLLSSQIQVIYINVDEMTRVIVEAVKKSRIRVILSKGWSARAKDAKETPDKEPQKKIEYPPNIYSLEKVPHDWLFPLCAAVFHHGGAGTCAAGLRAGIPTLIKPFFGDQYFWADRVTDVIYTNKMGVGLELKKFTVDSLAKALMKITTDLKMKEKAVEVGKCVRNEDGVRNAINYIYRDMDYSLERVKHLAKIHSKDGQESEIGANPTKKPK